MTIEQYIVKLEKMQSKLDNLDNVLDQAGFLVENEARRLCPVDTSQLRASIRHEVNHEEQAAYIGTNVEYAPYVEYGTGIYAAKGNGRQTPWSYKDAKGDWHFTKGQKPQPYLHPALANKAQEVEDLIKNSIKEELDNV